MHTPATLRFHKFSPGGNTTLLVMDAVEPSHRAAVAAALMHEHHVHAEQVGFVTLAGRVPRIDMMGGEFCGNACRSLAALLALLRVLPAIHGAGPETGTGGGPDGGADSVLTGIIASSGVTGVLPVRVAATARGLDAAVRMPLPEGASANDMVQPLGKGMALVRLPGISHLLLDAAHHPFPDQWRQRAIALLREHALDGEPAAGCIWHHEPRTPRITPVVMVRDTGSILLESACGSGTLAYGLLLAASGAGAAVTDVTQPSGAVIRVSVAGSAHGGVEAWIGGIVHRVASGTAYLHDAP